MKIALITGATSGMGREMVRQIILSEKNPDEIWILGRRRDRLEELQKQYPNVSFRLCAVDLLNADETNAFYNTMEKQNVRISVFVHAAGFGIMGDIDEIPVEELEEMADLNVRSCVGVTGHVLPHMIRGGQMIYFASSAAYLPQPGFAVYAASKAFVLSYVRALRAENRDRNLRITAICPGAVKTEFFNRAAQNKKIPSYKKFVMADKEKVVKKAWNDNQKGKEISIYGIPMNLFVLATKIIPHGCFLKFMGSKKGK